MFRSLLTSVWNSPSLMTWGSYSGRALSLFIVWPVLTVKLPTEEVALWLLFSTIGMLLIMFDLGFTPTFSRLFAYAMGGVKASKITLLSERRAGSQTYSDPNWELLGEVYGSARIIFRRISFVGLFILATFGTMAIYSTVIETSNTQIAWLSWAVVVIYSAISLFGRAYAVCLEGTNHIALVRRWDAVFAYLNILITLSVLLLGGGLLAVMLVYFVTTVASVIRNRWLCHLILDGRMSSLGIVTVSTEIWGVTWPNAWRSAIGVFMARGLIDLSGLLYAQFSSASELAEYLIAIRFIQTLSLFSRVPFYTRLPELSKLRAQKLYDKQVNIAAKAMLHSHMLFVVGFIFLALIGPRFFIVIGSNVRFPDETLWLLLGTAMFAERFGAMHIQLYTTSNHVLWHIVNGITGIIWIISFSILFPILGVLAFPLSFLIGYVGYYSWYSAYLSYNTFPMKFPSFEIRSSLLPVSIFILFSLSLYYN